MGHVCNGTWRSCNFHADGGEVGAGAAIVVKDIDADDNVLNGARLWGKPGAESPETIRETVLAGNRVHEILHIRQREDAIESQIELLLSPIAQAALCGWHLSGKASSFALEEQLRGLEDIKRRQLAVAVDVTTHARSIYGARSARLTVVCVRKAAAVAGG